MLVRQLVDEINARHGTDLRVVGRFPGGELGATRLVDGDGHGFVLKRKTPTPGADIAATTAALARVGYPAPRYVVVGDDYSVQEQLPGRALAAWTALDSRVVDRLIELNELQAGRAVLQPRDWPRVLVASVLEGEQEYMVLETLVRHSELARRLLERCQEAVRRYAGESMTKDDVVHWDFHAANVLAEGRRVTGVIDWDATTAGDRLFDLATLLYYLPESRRVHRYVAARTGFGLLSAYLAHMCIRQTEWSLRRHDGATGERMLSHALAVADEFGIGAE